MAKVRFTNSRRHSPRFWSWRELNRRIHVAQERDAEQMEEFADRAQTVRSEVEFLLSHGLSEGAADALTTLAEEDMVDFCIMVDLAEPISIPDVEPLQEGTRQHLQNFLDSEPWHSLAIDNDITVALALLDSVGAQPTNAPWYRYAPGMFDLISHVLNEANKEQLVRFMGEYDVLASRDHLVFSDEVTGLLETLLDQASHRVGLPGHRVQT